MASSAVALLLPRTEFMEVPQLRRRPSNAHKGDFGRTLIVGGSRGMSGAVALAGMAAIRSGAGLVTLAVPDVCLDTVASFNPNYMTVPLPCAEGQLVAAALNPILELAQSATSIAIGPGLGQSDELATLVARLYREYQGPLVVDADALNALARQPDDIATQYPRVLTPHIGEFRRLVGQPELSVEGCRQQVAKFAKQANVTVVLKGQASLVVGEGENYENTTGNPGMATGGSGDVLTGAIAALLCLPYLSTVEAAVLGVYIHGLAGDLGVKAFGQTSICASDIKDMLSVAFRTHERVTRMGFRT